MFIGEYSHSLDAKGRVTIPAKFREELGDTFVVTRSLDQCLTVYDMDAWEEFSRKLTELPYNSPEQRKRMSEHMKEVSALVSLLA